MKKFVSLTLLCMIIMSFSVAFAEPELVTVGNLLSTDIKTYINDQRINSYNVNGYTALIAEDLVKYGFKVDWNSEARTLTISKPDYAEFSGMTVSSDEKIEIGKKIGTAYYTDIRTIVGGVTVLSYNIDGKTAIFTDALRLYGDVSFSEETRSVYCEIEGLTYKKPLVTITDPEEENNKGDEETSNDITVEVPVPEDTEVSESEKKGYYSNGIVPDYTAVTEVPLKEKIEKANNYVSYIYDNYDEFMADKYITHIVDNEGFSFNKADKGEDDTIVYYYTKDNIALAVEIDNKNNTLTITCKK